MHNHDACTFSEDRQKLAVANAVAIANAYEPGEEIGSGMSWDECPDGEFMNSLFEQAVTAIQALRLQYAEEQQRNESLVSEPLTMLGTSLVWHEAEDPAENEGEDPEDLYPAGWVACGVMSDGTFARPMGARPHESIVQAQAEADRIEWDGKFLVVR